MVASPVAAAPTASGSGAAEGDYEDDFTPVNRLVWAWYHRRAPYLYQALSIYGTMAYLLIFVSSMPKKPNLSYPAALYPPLSLIFDDLLR